jgi:hypothetical protein
MTTKMIKMMLAMMMETTVTTKTTKIIKMMLEMMMKTMKMMVMMKMIVMMMLTKEKTCKQKLSSKINCQRKIDVNINVKNPFIPINCYNKYVSIIFFIIISYFFIFK